MAVKKILKVKGGTVTRNLTQTEIENLAPHDDECRLEIAKQELAAATTMQDEITAIKKFLKMV